MIDNSRLLQRFLEYVQIDSESGNEKNIADRLMKDLGELGCEVWRDNAGESFGSNGYNVYARLNGDSSMKPLIFSAHMDTVKPGNGVKPSVRDGVIRSDGTTILGGDDKSGVAAIIESLDTVIKNKLPHRTVEVLFTICEEGGLKGAKHADFSKFTAREALVLDSSGDTGKIMISAPGQIKFNAEVTGKSAHAGVAPETGINAIQAAAAGVAAMNLLRIDEETTANISVFTSEYATNIVPEKALVKGEVRSRSTGKLNAQAEHMKKCMQEACDKYGATLKLEMETAYLSYKIAEDDELVTLVSEACRKIGVTPVTASSGGGSDANIMNHGGIKSVVLATGMDKVHTTGEQLTVENLENTAKLCLELIKA